MCVAGGPDRDGRRMGDARQAGVGRLADLDGAVVEELGGDEAGAGGDDDGADRPLRRDSRRWPGSPRAPPPRTISAAGARRRATPRKNRAATGRSRGPAIAPSRFASARKPVSAADERRMGPLEPTVGGPVDAAAPPRRLLRNPEKTEPMRRRLAAIIARRSGSFFAACFAGPAGALFCADPRSGCRGASVSYTTHFERRLNFRPCT